MFSNEAWFERFERIAVVGDSRWHNKRSTGIGLAVSVGIVSLGETVL